MKVKNKINGNKCYARINKNGWKIINKNVVTFCTEKEFTSNYIILL